MIGRLFFFAAAVFLVGFISTSYGKKWYDVCHTSVLKVSDVVVITQVCYYEMMELV